MKKRVVLKSILASPFVLGLLRPLVALAEWNVDAFAAESETEALQVFFPGESIRPDSRINISVNERLENGAVVPLRIETDLDQVSSVSILVENNPNPLIAHFELNPRCLGMVATRIKMDVSSDVVAVVRSGGRLFSHRRYVEVVEGGCT